MLSILLGIWYSTQMPYIEPKESSGNITIKELIEFLQSLDRDGEVYLESGKQLSSPCISVWTLGGNDVILEHTEH